jgi:hypothetical protein
LNHKLPIISIAIGCAVLGGSYAFSEATMNHILFANITVANMMTATCDIVLLAAVVNAVYHFCKDDNTQSQVKH